MTEDNWPGEWLRGVLGVCVLRILMDGSSYGYAIIQRLAEAGLGAVKGGTLYPLLGRLEEAGHLEVEWRPGDGGPGRKFYALTEQGRREAAGQAARWAAFTATTRALTDGALSARDRPATNQVPTESPADPPEKELT
ncbi:PadR family transcriptional regulator [Citricoccus sp. I39-566]|uniref:PadR family transcriptional regulator n=1 Tax=Citricoccus sp. I39-566 TaxID=3073268 RepID=UPI00286A2C6B|nr:PadR family transcriptional regulator [Citricoccus sp. I39-566]WMY78622.1 PadR family transcriptional regulator [Citricoccus sp. I39-566]